MGMFEANSMRQLVQKGDPIETAGIDGMREVSIV